MTIENIYIGNTNDVTLLTATIYEVGRYAQAFLVVGFIHYTASIEQGDIVSLVNIHGWSNAFNILAHQNMGVAIYITLHSIARTINVEAGIFGALQQQVVGILQLRLVLASQHVALLVDGYVALDGSTLVTAAIDVTSHVGIVLFIRLWIKLVLDGKLDERIFRVGKSQQIATCVGSLSLVVVVGIVAATHYLVGDGKTLREDVIHHVANLLGFRFLEVGCSFRINVHVATVTAAAEGADGAVGKSFASCASVPGQRALDICFHWVEIQVDQVRIYLRTVFILCWQIEGTDYLVRWIVNPVDAVAKVQLLGIVLNATVQSLEHVHEVVLRSSGKEFITVTSHEHASDVDMATDVDFDVAHLLM